MLIYFLSFRDNKGEKVLVSFFVIDVFDKESSMFLLINILMCLLDIYSIIHLYVNMSFSTSILYSFNGLFMFQKTS
jgi:hypothetical protein